MSEVHIVDSVQAWLEQRASIHLKAVTAFGDPVELSSDEARMVAAALMRLADELDAADSAS